ncbi:hypothetical protein HY991_06175 [Candidatus Micrarchaeota archaeon]|nr:hypothetical protein [Candidatus Micrarchaeota archaeon]
MKQWNVNRIFLVSIILLLVIETLAPTTHAKEESVSFAASCSLDDVLSNSLERERFWDNTWGDSGGFQAQEINELTPEAAKSPGHVAGNVSPVTVNVFYPGADRVPLSDLAAVAGTTPGELAEELGVPENSFLSPVQIEAYVQKHPEKGQGIAKFLESLGMKKGVEYELPAYENMMVKLPIGTMISLGDLAKMEQLNPEGCMLDSSEIRGKVSYVAELNNDLFLGNEKSIVTVTKKERDTPQYLTSNNLLAILSLNGGGSVVLPRAYMRYAGAIKTILEVDTILNLIWAWEAFIEKRTATKRMEKEEFLNKLAGDSRAFDTDALKAIGGDADKNLFYSTFSRNSLSAGEATNLINKLKAEGKVGPGIIDSIEKRVLAAKDDAGRITAFRADESTILNNYGFSQAELQELSRNKQRVVFQTELAKIQEEGIVTPLELEKAERTFNILSSKVVNNMVFGMLWLGPGRLALQLADNVVFRSPGSNLNEHYLEVYAAKDVGQDFRYATNWMMSGSIYDLVSKYTRTGIPPDVYHIGKVILINEPMEKYVADEYSTTSIGAGESGWELKTSWTGRSEGTFFENIWEQEKDYARMHLYSNNMTWDVNIVKKNMQTMSSYYEILVYLAPLLSWKFIKFPSEPLTPLTRVFVMDLYLSHFIDPANYDKKQMCSDGEVNKLIFLYGLATGAQQLLNFAMLEMPAAKAFASRATFFTKYTKKVPSLHSLGNAVYQAVNIAQPLEIAKMYLAGRGLDYVSRCKDTSYTIMSYQKLSKVKSKGVDFQKKMKPMTDLMGKLQLSSLLGNVQQQITKSEMKEIINLRSVMNNQHGMVTPDAIYYMHWDTASHQWWNNWNQTKGCMRFCYESKGALICDTANGTIKYDKETGAAMKLLDGSRALKAWRRIDLTRTLYPNKIISTKMDCDGKVVFEIPLSMNLYARDSCGGAKQCIQDKLKDVSGKRVGDDLSFVLGKVLSFYTTEGRGTISGGKIRFIHAVETREVKRGQETQVPDIESELALGGRAYPGTSVQVLGNGTVRINGYFGEKFTNSSFGEIRTIFLENGRIDYSPVDKRLDVSLFTLAKVQNQDIKQIDLKPATNKDATGRDAPAIQLFNIQPRTGREESALELETALDKIQYDKEGNKMGGMQGFETKDHVYYLTRNEKGEPILRVIDKNTGETKDYKITGPLRKEGNDIIIPTDKGNFRFNLGMDNGVPTAHVSGPDGFKEIAALLAARGPSGMISVTPSFIQGFNAQDLPYNPNFMRNGASLVGSPDGTRGVPQENLLAPRPQRSAGTSGMGPLMMASFPEEPLWIAAMLSAIVGGVLVVRIVLLQKKKRK